jgi:hypothetical protein
LAPLALNSSGFCEARQESLSRMPQTVMPVQRDTARQSLTTLRYQVALAFSMSSSVI